MYDVATGEIRHTHRVVTFEGGTDPSEEQIAEQAIALARKRIASGPVLAALHVEPHEYKLGSRYAVDHERKALVEHS